MDYPLRPVFTHWISVAGLGRVEVLDYVPGCAQIDVIPSP
jgi:hypothetical protein